MLNTKNKIVLLDRDGVINQDSDAYIKSADEWHAIPGSLEAMAQLCQAGYRLFVVTNQSGLGRGLFTEVELTAMHDKMRHQLSKLGGHITDIVYCPHHPDEKCLCRKPGTALLETLQTRHGLNFDQIPFVGDTTKDLECAAAMGATGVLVRTGKGEKTLEKLREQHTKNQSPYNTPTYANLADAVRDWLTK